MDGRWRMDERLVRNLHGRRGRDGQRLCDLLWSTRWNDRSRVQKSGSSIGTKVEQAICKV